MKMDAAIAALARPSVARVCIEMDLLNKFLVFGRGSLMRKSVNIVPSV